MTRGWHLRCVVFDFDGVLVDSNAIKRQAYFRIFEHVGQPAVIHECLERWRLGTRFDVIRCIVERLAGSSTDAPSALDERIQFYAERYNDICESAVSVCDEVEGASECLALLSDRLPLYVNSATPEEPLRRIVERRGWSDFFRGVLGAPQSKVENLERILALEQLDSDTVAFVGDSQGDLTAARLCGCRFVGVRNVSNDFDGARVVMVDTLRGLAPVLAVTR